MTVNRQGAKKLRSDSTAWRVLERLARSQTNSLHIDQLADLVKPERIAATLAVRLRELCDKAIGMRLIAVERNVWHITPRGLLHLTQIDECTTPTVPLTANTPENLTPARTARPFRPLRPSCPSPHYRPGAYDYLRIPSLVGQVRRLPDGKEVKP